MQNNKNKQSINLLELKPCRMNQFEVDNNRVVIFVPKFKSKWGKWMMAKMKKPNYKVTLDEFGTAVWNSCDGEKTIKDIGVLLKKNFGDKIEPVYERLNLFIRNLEKYKLIRFRNLSQ